MAPSERPPGSIPTGFGPLDDALGGGLPRGKLTVFSAVTGCAKTTTASLITGAAGSRGCKVKLISTDEHPGALVQRSISSMCDIPYADVLNNQYPSDPASVARVRDYLSNLSKHVSPSWWQSRSGKTLKGDLIRELLSAQDQLGSVDLLVLDYLDLDTAGVDPALKSDYRHVEPVMREAGHFLSEFAREHNIAVFATAQVAPRYIGMKHTSHHLCYCKRLAERAEHLICLSSFSGDDQEMTYAPEQFLSVYKHNRLVKHVPVLRDFGYQRFMGR